jgi:hemoglobin
MQNLSGLARTGSSFTWRRVAGAAVLVALVSLAGLALAQDRPAAAKSLYQRLGGYDAIAAVVDDFLAELKVDPMFQRFGQGRGQDSLMRSRQLLVDQICHLAGGPCLYIGRDMKVAHKGLAITEAEFEAAGKKMTASLQKLKVPEAEQQELMAVIGKLQADIVEKPAAAAPGTSTRD